MAPSGTVWSPIRTVGSCTYQNLLNKLVKLSQKLVQTCAELEHAKCYASEILNSTQRTSGFETHFKSLGDLSVATTQFGSRKRENGWRKLSVDSCHACSSVRSGVQQCRHSCLTAGQTDRCVNLPVRHGLLKNDTYTRHGRFTNMSYVQCLM